MVIFEKEDVNKLVTLAAFLSCKGKIKMVTYINESCWLVSLKPPMLNQHLHKLFLRYLQIMGNSCLTFFNRINGTIINNICEC